MNSHAKVAPCLRVPLRLVPCNSIQSAKLRMKHLRELETVNLPKNGEVTCYTLRENCHVCGFDRNSHANLCPAPDAHDGVHMKSHNLRVEEKKSRNAAIRPPPYSGAHRRSELGKTCGTSTTDSSSATNGRCTIPQLTTRWENPKAGCRIIRGITVARMEGNMLDTYSDHRGLGSNVGTFRSAK